jgi:hypothetical protein
MIKNNSHGALSGQLSKLFTLVLVVVFAFSIAGQKPASALQMDIPLDQALVLLGGESTNPRD